MTLDANNRCSLHSLVRYPVSKELTVAQLVKKCPDFYGTRSFITAFETDRHQTLF
jgi:hypothetical protein